MNFFNNEIWQIILRLAFYGAAIYFGLATLLFFLQTRLIYYPSREIVATPDGIGLSYRAVSFESADGVHLSGWFVPSVPSRGVILFCHGNAGNISHRLESIEIFHSLGLSTFIFDYRGYGQSKGNPSEKGTYLDAEAAWDYLVRKERLPPSGIIIFGRSLGGAVASRLAGNHSPKALILESTFTSARDMASGLYPFLPSLLCRFKYDAIAAIPHVDCPVLVVHSPHDEIVPFSHGRRLYEAAREPKEFLEITADHNSGFLVSGKVYTQGLEAFISRLKI